MHTHIAWNQVCITCATYDTVRQTLLDVPGDVTALTMLDRRPIMSVPAAPLPAEASSGGGEFVSSFTFFMFSCRTTPAAANRTRQADRQAAHSRGNARHRRVFEKKERNQRSSTAVAVAEAVAEAEANARHRRNAKTMAVLCRNLEIDAGSVLP